MSNLLDHAIDAVKRLPEDRQNVVAEAMLALAESEDAGPFDFELPGETPTEEEIAALMPTVMPSAVPTKAEVAAWSRLSHAEQVRRYRVSLSHPDCFTDSGKTMGDILAEARQRSAERQRD